MPCLLVVGPYWPEDSLLHEFFEFAGHLFVYAGVLVRLLATVYIGGHKNKLLATTGLFSIVRNPLYVGSFLASVGVAMMTASITALALVVLAFCLYYRVTVQREEDRLQTEFGDCYREYTHRVPRWIPDPTLWNEPGEITMRPFFLRQAALDASMFLVLIPFLELLCELRENGFLPTLMVLP